MAWWTFPSLNPGKYREVIIIGILMEVEGFEMLPQSVQIRILRMASFRRASLAAHYDLENRTRRLLEGRMKLWMPKRGGYDRGYEDGGRKDMKTPGGGRFYHRLWTMLKVVLFPPPKPKGFFDLPTELRTRILDLAIVLDPEKKRRVSHWKERRVWKGGLRLPGEPHYVEGQAKRHSSWYAVYELVNPAAELNLIIAEIAKGFCYKLDKQSLLETYCLGTTLIASIRPNPDLTTKSSQPATIYYGSFAQHPDLETHVRSLHIVGIFISSQDHVKDLVEKVREIVGRCPLLVLIFSFKDFLGKNMAAREEYAMGEPLGICTHHLRRWQTKFPIRG